MKNHILCTICLFATTLFAISTSSAQENVNQEYYELRTYTLSSQDQLQALEQYIEHAAIPTFNKMGIKAIGVFNEMEKSEQPKLYVLIPYKSLEYYDSAQRIFLQEVTLH